MKTHETKCWAIVPAAGIGTRMQCDTPKQYMMLDNKPILQHTLEKLLATNLFEKIVLVLAADDTMGERIAQKFPKVQLSLGGTLRFDSVYSGMQVLQKSAHDNDFVFVHDAARPNVTPEDILKLFNTIKNDPVGGILGHPVRDTIKSVHGNTIERTVDRHKLWHALTPQAFRFAKLLQGMQIAMHNKQAITDEASVIEQAGLPVQMVLGRSDNIKITYAQDLKTAEEVLCE